MLKWYLMYDCFIVVIVIDVLLVIDQFDQTQSNIIDYGDILERGN